jgi:hypothetical protein
MKSDFDGDVRLVNVDRSVAGSETEVVRFYHILGASDDITIIRLDHVPNSYDDP